MKKNDEKMADLGLKQLGVNPQIYHFDVRVHPFTAISIATTGATWVAVRASLDSILTGVLPTLQHEKATRLRKELAHRNIYGVSICDGRDPFNRRQGRTTAKGRLLKHLQKLGDNRNGN